MMYEVFYSAEARQDLREIYEYISQVLLAPKAAASQAHTIMKTVQSLKQLPLRHRLYDEEPWHSIGLRFVPVGKFWVFYLPDETTKVVSIVRIMYGGRDIKNCLSKTSEN